MTFHEAQKKRIQAVGFIFLLLPVLTFCSSTKLTHVWKDDAYSGRPIGNVLVLAVANEIAIRRSYETKFVEKLRQAGVEAEPSFTLLPSTGELQKEEIVAAVNKVGADSVIITHLVRVDEKEVYRPPEIRSVPMYGYGYYGHYGRAYEYIHRPGYTTTKVNVVLETNLYHVADEKLMWSARSETIDRGSEERLMESVIDSVISDLKAKNLLASKKNS